MITQTVVCDSCGTVKKETNHWFKVSMNANDSIPPRFYLVRSDVDLPLDLDKKIVDLCGEYCVLKEVSKFLGRLSK